MTIFQRRVENKKIDEMKVADEYREEGEKSRWKGEKKTRLKAFDHERRVSEIARCEMEREKDECRGEVKRP